MTIYLIRHAFAGEPGDPRYPDDSLRPLTKKGRKQFARLVKRLVKRGLAAGAIGTSPYLRCVQTAEILCDRLAGDRQLDLVDSFAPGSDVADLCAWAAGKTEEELAYVGHAPDIDRILAALLGGAEGAFRCSKGAVARVDFAEEVTPGKGTLRWLVMPRLID
jgi:phosphohistidine phosphatase